MMKHLEIAAVMGTRGSLRSETRATHAALRGGGMESLNAVREDADATPPPSPHSAAMLAAFGFGVDDREEEEDTKGNMSDSDSDFSAEETKPRKSKKRRLRQRIARPKEPKRQATARVEEREEEEVEEERKPTPRFKSDRRAQAQQNWVDDGCPATFETRLQELRRSLQQSVREKRVTFYNRPRSAQEAEEEEEKEDDAMDEMEDGGFHDEREEDVGGSGGVPSSSSAGGDVEEEEVYYSPHDRLTTDSGLSVPSYMYAHLFPHQKECLEWLHHLHERNTGGILGDEMGLGKTVQIASFLGAMYDAKRVRTVLLLCPASVLLQWVREFHKWYPWLRIVLLHASGTGGTRAGRNYAQLIEEVMQLGGDEEERGGGVVVSTYENVRQYQELFLDLEWDYVVLDEGHRIRNPDAEITLVCKQLQTVHRIILTGTPIQNRLRELWSLFDFVYPGKLGTLPTFEDEFVLPIRTGGYANASKMQVVMAYKCALALKEVINPFMLRRTKKEIQHVTKLPEKMEQILFCSLTARQYETYELFLSSPEVAAVLRQDMRPFRAISILRHICNHPDLLSTVGDYNVNSADRGTDIRQLAKRPPGVPYGDPEGSGKMRVLDKVLALWKQQGHRVLVFTQTRKMLDILESFMAAKGYKHCRLDGTTSVKERQSLLDAFNRDGSEIFVFLLTTRAGGIGVNLTGADRVVIFDPDWNPSTDLQARERSWRLGQTKQVTVYRLITSGTIEEKIYHRQIFKQYLTNKVLHDAKRKRCFNKHSLRDLFILGDQNAAENGGSVETTELFLEGNVAHPGQQSREGMEGGEIEEEGLASDNERLGDSSEERDAEEKPSGGTGGGDNNEILRQLFDGDQMIQGVFNHDVVESDGVQNQEADLIELESSKIAQSALGALRASCALVRQQRASLFTPTWTGRSGVAGDPTQRSSGSGDTGAGPRFGNRVARGRQGSGAVVNLVGNRGVGASVARVSTNPFAQATTSSRDMLARMKNRKNGIANGGGTTRANARPAAASAPHLGNNGFLKADDMATQLHAFLLLRSKPPRAPGVTTEELLDGFGAVVAPKDKLVFRTLLRDMAVCRGRKWVLKDEFLTGL